MRDGELLLCRLVDNDTLLTPGGGLENGESLEECCAREALEETGYIVRPTECFLCLNEYYENAKYITYFFLCEIIGEGERSLTAAEQRAGLEYKWIDLSDAMRIFSRHADYDGIDEEKRGIYQREFIALSEALPRLGLTE